MRIRILFNPAVCQAADRSESILEHKFALAIGNFDGVHLGHQMVIKQLMQQASMSGFKSGVCVFEPQPLEYFMPESAPIRLMGIRDKTEALFEQGVDCVVLCRFNAELSKMSAQDFMATIQAALPLGALVVGQDFRFGYKRKGDVTFLQGYGKAHGMEVKVLADLTQEGERVSSSAIRAAIQRHEFAVAKSLLGRPFMLAGKVKYGQQLARKLGYPTANLHIYRRRPPLNGVFVGRAYLPYNGASRSQVSYALANCGTKPSISGRVWQVEVHVLETGAQQSERSIETEHLYGQRMAFEPLAFVREEKRFESLAELQSAIQQDAAAAASFFHSFQ